MYSFTKPKPKPFFKEDTKLWLIFYIISISLYFTFSAFLLFKAYIFKKDVDNLNNQIIILNKKIKFLSREKKEITLQQNLYSEIINQNTLIKQNIQNLLDLIPKSIIINKFLLLKNQLVLYGTIPNKRVYNLLLLPALKSLFEETKTYFYQLPNGWYKFKSINILTKTTKEFSL